MTFYEIIITILTVLFGFLSLYFKTKVQLKDNIVKAIADAEGAYLDTAKAGGEKFEMAINLVYENIPKALKPIFTRELISALTQSAFNEMQRFITKKLDDTMEQIESKTEK